MTDAAPHARRVETPTGGSDAVHRERRGRGAASLLFSLIPGLFGIPVHAQQTSGRIDGVVTDQLGAGVSVTLGGD